MCAVLCDSECLDDLVNCTSQRFHSLIETQALHGVTRCRPLFLFCSHTTQCLHSLFQPQTKHILMPSGHSNRRHNTVQLILCRSLFFLGSAAPKPSRSGIQSHIQLQTKHVLMPSGHSNRTHNTVQLILSRSIAVFLFCSHTTQCLHSLFQPQTKHMLTPSVLPQRRHNTV
jgi:hypothetical protein